MAYREVGAAGVLAPRAANSVRWGAVWSGTVVGVGTMALLTALWLALGYANNVGFIADNMTWWLGGTAIFSFLLAGFLAGLTGGVRGAGAGFVNGLTTWGLVALFGVAIGMVIAAGTLDLSQRSLSAVAGQVAGNDLWVSFYALVIGLGACAVGGTLGGLLPRPGYAARMVEHRVEHHDVYPDAADTAVIDEPGRHRVL